MLMNVGIPLGQVVKLKKIWWLIIYAIKYWFSFNEDNKDKLKFISFFLSDFWCKIVLKFTSSIVEFILNHKRGLSWHIKGDLSRKSSCLREEIEITSSETERNRLINFKSHFVFISSLSLVQHCITSSHFSGYRKLDALFVSLYLNGFGESTKLSANSVEFCRGHSAHRTEFSLRNT